MSHALPAWHDTTTREGSVSADRARRLPIMRGGQRWQPGSFADDPDRWRTEIAPFRKVASEADSIFRSARDELRCANMKPVEFEAARRTRVADHVAREHRRSSGHAPVNAEAVFDLVTMLHGAHRVTCHSLGGGAALGGSGSDVFSYNRK